MCMRASLLRDNDDAVDLHTQAATLWLQMSAGAPNDMQLRDLQLINFQCDIWQVSESISFASERPI